MKLKKLTIVSSFVVAALLVAGLPAAMVNAANTPTFNQTINPGTLTTDILDASRNPVASPSFNMSATNLSFECQTSTGALGSDSQRVYVINPGGADNGWTLTMGATDGGAAQWESGSDAFDYNDETGGGCDNGQLTVDPSAGTLTPDCDNCTSTGVSQGSETAFSSSAASVTLLNASDTSADVWRGYLTDAGLSQEIPAAQAAGTYTLDMTLTATAS